MIFEPVVGDFCEDFSSKEFFDSLVRWPDIITRSKEKILTTLATFQKRQDLMIFIERNLEPEHAVEAVVGIGSIANGLARQDSDIDAIVFLDPFNWYIIPAEFNWRPADNTCHSIFHQASSRREMDSV